MPHPQQGRYDQDRAENHREAVIVRRTKGGTGGADVVSSRISHKNMILFWRSHQKRNEINKPQDFGMKGFDPLPRKLNGCRTTA
jgi:hypothetical protein